VPREEGERVGHCVGLQQRTQHEQHHRPQIRLGLGLVRDIKSI
jgi:hypothetical protein